jgi:hypothetical protein
MTDGLKLEDVTGIVNAYLEMITVGSEHAEFCFIPTSVLKQFALDHIIDQQSEW